MNTYTDYGVVTVTDNGVAIEADGAQLYAWANRSGCKWPLSELARMDYIRAEFDADGLLDLEERWNDAPGELTADEFNAWSADVLRGVLPESHPAYFVNVGQFS